MCKFFSCLVTKDGDCLWHEATDSHSDLVTHFGFSDVKKYLNRFAKFEFTPEIVKDVPQYGNAKAYTLRVDEDTTPAWFAEIENSVTKKLREIIKSMIVDDKRPLVLGGRRILVDCADVGEAKNSQLWMCGGTLNAMCGGTLNEICGGTLNAMRGGTLNAMRGGTLNEMWGGTLNEIDRRYAKVPASVKSTKETVVQS